MKKYSSLFLAGLMSLGAWGQAGSGSNTLLWKVSGNGLAKPSYIYGTIHMICSDDANLSANFRKAISDCDEVYFEVDMDNLLEIFGAVGNMKMKGDTTLRDLLSEEDYKKVKEYFEDRSTMLPFSMLETFKPMLAASTLEEGAMPCEKTTMMEQVIMREAKMHHKSIRGLETMSYQAGILDSIPYKLQADQLVNYINEAGKGTKEEEQMKEMFQAYREQDLKKLEKMMLATDAGMSAFTDILLFHRNQNWVNKLKLLMAERSLVVAVGAGHLPGEKGLIQLLRKEGFRVEPVDNRIDTIKEI